MVIPAFNGAGLIESQLDALSKQVFESEWEVVVADNGSSDQTVEIASGYEDRLPIRVIDASARRGNAAARNLGAFSAKGERLLFVDQDDEVAPGWLRSMNEALAQNDLVVGSLALAFRWEDRHQQPVQLPMSQDPYNFLGYGLSANMGITRGAFNLLRGFDESFGSACDLDICWRAQLADLRVEGVDEAVVLKRRKDTGYFRQHMAFGVDDAQLYERYRQHGMQRQAGQALRSYAWLVTRLLGALVNSRTRATWIRVLGRSLGRIRGSIAKGVFYP